MGAEPSWRDRDLLIGVGLAVLLHLGIGWWGAGIELQHTPMVVPPRHVAKAVYEDIVLPKPPPPPPKTIEPKVEPKPEPKPEPVVKKKAPKPKKLKGQPKRKKRRKKAKKPAKPKPSEPAPLVLSQTYGATDNGKGVTVQSGDEDMFGDPAIEANERNTRPRGDDDDGPNTATPGPKGEGGEHRITIVHARPKSRCQVTWPEGAPQSRRIVEVTLLLRIDIRGRAKTQRILKSAGEPFDSAAKAALRRCRFTAGTRDGKAFADRVPFIVEFRPGSGA